MRLYGPFCVALLIAASALLAYGSPASEARSRARPAMAAYKRAHPACEWCGRKAPALRPNEVHHIIRCETMPDLAAGPSNMITLCRACHIVVGHNGDGACRVSVVNLRTLIQIKAVSP